MALFDIMTIVALAYIIINNHSHYYSAIIIINVKEIVIVQKKNDVIVVMVNMYGFMDFGLILGAIFSIESMLKFQLEQSIGMMFFFISYSSQLSFFLFISVFMFSHCKIECHVPAINIKIFIIVILVFF